MKKLEECPFCGGKPEIKKYSYHRCNPAGVQPKEIITKYRIMCCLMINSDTLYQSRKTAIIAWNKRIS